MTTTALHTATLSSLPLLARGKVRDNYVVGDDRLLMVASDRISAYDVIMTQPIPGKGALLTQMALFWFDQLKDLCPNHLTGDDPLSVVSEADKPVVAGRAMLVKRLRPIPVEAVVRGYLAGSGWKSTKPAKACVKCRCPAVWSTRPNCQSPSLRLRPRRTPATMMRTSVSSEWLPPLVGTWPSAYARPAYLSTQPLRAWH